MKYTIKLSKSDTEGLRQIVSQAFAAGKDFEAASDAQTKSNMKEWFARLLHDVDPQAQRIAEEAFAAGSKVTDLQ